MARPSATARPVRGPLSLELLLLGQIVESVRRQGHVRQSPPARWRGLVLNTGATSQRGAAPRSWAAWERDGNWHLLPDRHPGFPLVNENVPTPVILGCTKS